MASARQKQANRELVEQFLVWMRDDKGCQPASVYDYASRLERFLDFAGPLPLNNVKVDVLRAWVNRPKGGRAHGTIGKPATRSKDVAVLRSLFNYLHASELVERNPTVLLVAPKVHNRNPKPIPEDVWIRLWNSSAITDEARVVLGLGFFIGLRREEIVRLSPTHFSLPPRMLIGFTRKGGGDDVTEYGAIVDVWADLMPHLIGDPQSLLGPLHELVQSRAGKARLLDWREHQKPCAYNTGKHSLGDHDLDPEWVNSRLETWLGRSGLPRNAFTPHQLRHSAATYLKRAGLEDSMVADLLNHSSVNITRRYVKVAGGDVDAWRRNRLAQLDAQEEGLTGRFNRHR